MEIREIASDTDSVGQLMSRIIPAWWPTPQDAVRQLEKGRGWFGSIDGRPMAWLMFRYHPEYKLIEINCMGYDLEGQLDVGHQLNPLMDKCREWGLAQGAASIIYIIGSTRLSCHKKEISTPWQDLQNLKGSGSGQYEWLLSLGFMPAGLLPNTYNPGHHGVLLLKTL